MHVESPIRKFALITDAWTPQVNGVVTTLTQMVRELEQKDITVEVFQPNDYKFFSMPTYPEIPVVWSAENLERRLLDFLPDAIHIATEGGLGWRARNICLKHKLPFTTGYHTKYPEYIHQRFPVPASWIYSLLRRFHNKGQMTYVPSESTLKELKEHGFKSLTVVTRGVDTDTFNPNRRIEMDFPKPIYLSVGRIAPEKNLETFLDLDLPGTKVVVGRGPLLEELQERYPDAVFVGAKFGEELATYYASADVFVFPSLTDTYGVVNIEAIACGLPVAAFPVTGPKDIITQGLNGWMDDDLKVAVEKCLTLDRSQVADSIGGLTWDEAADQFLSNLSYIDWNED